MRWGGWEATERFWKSQDELDESWWNGSVLWREWGAVNEDLYKDRLVSILNRGIRNQLNHNNTWVRFCRWQNIQLENLEPFFYIRGKRVSLCEKAHVKVNLTHVMSLRELFTCTVQHKCLPSSRVPGLQYCVRRAVWGYTLLHCRTFSTILHNSFPFFIILGHKKDKPKKEDIINRSVGYMRL